MDLGGLGDEGTEPRGKGGKMPRSWRTAQGLRWDKGIRPLQETQAKWVKVPGGKGRLGEVDGLRMACFGAAILSLAPFSSVLLIKAALGVPMALVSIPQETGSPWSVGQCGAGPSQEMVCVVQRHMHHPLSISVVILKSCLIPSLLKGALSYCCGSSVLFKKQE